jgi:hypothetical protein
MPEERLFHQSPAQRDSVMRALSRVLEAETDVLFAYLHGSFATGGPFHDVDVAVYLQPRPSPSDPRAQPSGLRAMTLSSHLERALAQDVEGEAPPVDVRVLNQAPLGFRYQALRGGHLLMTRDESRRVEWVARTVARYLDLKPLRERALKEAMTACR